MIVTCPECATRYAVDDAAFKTGGRAVRCAHCACEWYQIGSNTPTDRAADPSAFPMSIDQDGPSALPQAAPTRTAGAPRSASEHLQAARRSLAGGAVDARPASSAMGPERGDRDDRDSASRDSHAASNQDSFFADEDELERARAALGVSSRPAPPERRPGGLRAVVDRGGVSDRIQPPEPWRGGAAALDGAAVRALDDDLFESLHETAMEMPPEPQSARHAFEQTSRRANVARPGARDFRATDPGDARDRGDARDLDESAAGSRDFGKGDFDTGGFGGDADVDDSDMVDGFDNYDRAYTPAVAAAARREAARAGGVSYKTTAFGRSDGALRRPTRSRRRPATQERSEPADIDFSPSLRDGALRRPSLGESALFDPARDNSFNPNPRLEPDLAVSKRRPARGRGVARLTLAVALVGGGLFAAYALGPKFAEIAPVAAPTVEAYRDRVNAVFSNAPTAQPGRSSGLAFVDFQYDLVERAEGPALEVWGRVANNGTEPVLTPTIEIVSRNTEGEALQRWLAHPEVDKLGVGETARFTSRMMYPLGPVSDVDLYIAPR